MKEMKIEYYESTQEFRSVNNHVALCDSINNEVQILTGPANVSGLKNSYATALIISALINKLNNGSIDFKNSIKDLAFEELGNDLDFSDSVKIDIKDLISEMIFD